MTEAAPIPREVTAVLAVQARIRSLPLIKQQRVALIVEQVASVLAAEPDLTVRTLAIAMANLTATTEIKNAQAQVGPQVAP